MHIFYFSGTGNSYYVAKKIGGINDQVKITSITSFSSKGKKQSDDETIVIISPLYFYSIPNIVASFLKNMEFSNLKYLSVIFTAEYPNGLAMNAVKNICVQRNINLGSSFYLKMPTNYLIKSKMLSNMEIEETLQKANKKINRIMGIIKDRKVYYEKDSMLFSLITKANQYQNKWNEDFLQFDKKFICNDSCTACKLCEKSCPVGNIKVDQKPSWTGKCQACLKCINICPKEAIQYDHFTEGKKRYFNPKIKISEMV